MKTKEESSTCSGDCCKTARHIANLEECLAGYMVSCAINGSYMTDEMSAWCHARLKGAQRAPAAVWREVAAFKE